VCSRRGERGTSSGSPFWGLPLEEKRIGAISGEKPIENLLEKLIGLELCFGGAKPPLPWQRDCAEKLQFALCNWLRKVLRLRDMSNFLFRPIRVTGPNVAQRLQILSVLLHEVKPVLGLFCLYLNTVGWSGHVASTICRDNWLGLKSLWLGFTISACGQGLWSSFKFSG